MPVRILNLHFTKKHTIPMQKSFCIVNKLDSDFIRSHFFQLTKFVMLPDGEQLPVSCEDAEIVVQPGSSAEHNRQGNDDVVGVSDEHGAGKRNADNESDIMVDKSKLVPKAVVPTMEYITSFTSKGVGASASSGPPGVEGLDSWLSSNMVEFVNFIHTYSTSGDREKRWAIIRYVQRQTSIFLGQSSTLHPSQVAMPFGSFTYGMYLPWASDLDMVLTDESFLNNPEVRMRQLANHFSKQKNHCVQAPPVVVSRTRVPFIQLLLAPPHHARGLIDQSHCGLCRMGYVNLCPSHSPIPVQLSLSVKDHAGLVSTASVNYLVAHYPVIRSIVLVLKHILVSENLNSPFEGGLSSHSLIILVTAFVRHFHPHDHNVAQPGTLFLQLLCWYGGIIDGHHKVYTSFDDNDKGMISSFDPSSMAVDIKGDSDCFRQKAANSTESTELLYVVDPLDKTHNAARSMWRWIDLKKTLTNAYWNIYAGNWWGAMGAQANAGGTDVPDTVVNSNLTTNSCNSPRNDEDDSKSVVSEGNQFE